MNRSIFCTLTALLAAFTLAAGAAFTQADEPAALLLAPELEDQELLQPELQLPRMGFLSQFVVGKGARVTGIIFDSEAERMGLEVGDMVVGINGQKLKTPGDWKAIISDVLHHHDEDVLLYGAQQSGEMQLKLKPTLKPSHEHIITLHIRDWRTGVIATRKTNLKNWE